MTSERKGKFMRKFLVLLLVMIQCLSMVSFASNDVLAPQNLMTPPNAQTDTTITLLWDKPETYDNVEGYKIYNGGTYVGSTTKGNYTVTGLTEGTSYSFTVKAYDTDGNLSAASNSLTAETKVFGDVIDVTEAPYNAAGDGTTNDTEVIQAAINDCEDGEIVYLPEGYTFKTGALFLKSNMVFKIDGHLQGSTSYEDYLPLIDSRWEGHEYQTFASLLNLGQMAGDDRTTHQIENVIICGSGSIHGGGDTLGNNEKYSPYGDALTEIPLHNNKPQRIRGRLVCMMNANNIAVSGLTIEDGPSWTFQPIYSSNLTFMDLNIDTYGVHNGDGIDPDSSEDVFIFNCEIRTGDDCIAIKSGKDNEGYQIGIPSQRIRITDCEFTNGHGGVVFGSEMSGGIKDVFIQDVEITIPSNYPGLRFKTTAKRGGTVENITAKDVLINNVGSDAIRLTTVYTANTDPHSPAAPVNPVFNNFLFENINVLDGGRAVKITGMSEEPIKNITFKNCSFNTTNGVKINNGKNITFTDVVINNSNGPKYDVTNSENVVIDYTSSLIEDLSINGDEVWSINETLDTNDLLYTDRDITIESIPEAYEDLEWIRTANDSKTYNDTNTLASFTASRDINVYVAADDRTKDDLAWLSEWEETDDDITSDNDETLSIFKKSFSEDETISLGIVDESSTNMYIVILEPNTIVSTTAWYKIKHQSSNKFLDSEGNGELALREAKNQDDQLWRFVEHSDGTFSIDNKRDNRGYLDSESNNEVVWKASESNTSDDVKWTLDKISGDLFRMENVKSGRGYLVRGSGDTVEWNDGTQNDNSKWLLIKQ